MSKEELTCLEKEDTEETQELESYLTPSDMVRTADHRQPVNVKLDSTTMLGPSGKEKGKDSPLMSAASYPGQEWNPFGDAWIGDDS